MGVDWHALDIGGKRSLELIRRDVGPICNEAKNESGYTDAFGGEAKCMVINREQLLVLYLSIQEDSEYGEAEIKNVAALMDWMLVFAVWEVLIAGDPDACWPWTIPDPNNQPRSMRDPEWKHYTVYGDQPLWKEE